MRCEKRLYVSGRWSPEGSRWSGGCTARERERADCGKYGGELELVACLHGGDIGACLFSRTLHHEFDSPQRSSFRVEINTTLHDVRNSVQQCRHEHRIQTLPVPTPRSSRKAPLHARASRFGAEAIGHSHSPLRARDRCQVQSGAANVCSIRARIVNVWRARSLGEFKQLPEDTVRRYGILRCQLWLTRLGSSYCAAHVMDGVSFDWSSTDSSRQLATNSSRREPRAA